MKLLIPSTLLLAAAMAPAQTFQIRGGPEDVRNTQNQFFLDCTNISLVSSTVDLNALVNQNANVLMDVQDVSTPGNTTLNVLSATVVPEIMDMGNLRLGRSDTWEVIAPAGSFAFVFIDFTANTRFLPFGAPGSFVLGPGAATLRSGVTSNQGRLQFSFFMPNIPSLVGTSFTSQALVDLNGNWTFSDPDCKTVEQQ